MTIQINGKQIENPSINQIVIGLGTCICSIESHILSLKHGSSRGWTAEENANYVGERIEIHVEELKKLQLALLETNNKLKSLLL